MKPTIDEVLQALVHLSRQKDSNQWVYVEDLAEQLYTHYDNILPSLLMLARDGSINFSSRKKVAVTLLNRSMAA